MIHPDLVILTCHRIAPSLHLTKHMGEDPRDSAHIPVGSWPLCRAHNTNGDSQFEPTSVYAESDQREKKIK